MLTILIGLKQTKQIETYLLFPEFARQFSGITKGNTYKRYFIAVSSGQHDAGIMIM